MIDGHNRYAICRKHNLPFETKEAQGLETELDVKLWMIKNQFGRRNLSIATRLDLAFQFKEIEQEKARSRQGARVDLVKNNCDEVNICKDFYTSEEVEVSNQEQGRTLEAIAKMADVSHMTAFKYEKLIDKAPEEVKQELKQGKISIDRAYRNLQKQERIETLKTAKFPDGKYRVIYADPPWQYGDERPPNHGGAVDHYPTMSITDLCNMPIDTLTDDSAVLFLWTTSPILEEAFKIINTWGFKYKAQFIWDKVKHNMGHYCSVRHEILLIATKGSCVPDNMKLFDSVQTIERTDKHSEKPEEFRNIIETLYTYGNKLELFARKPTEGWTVYGNEC